MVPRAGAPGLAVPLPGAGGERGPGDEPLPSALRGQRRPQPHRAVPAPERSQAPLLELWGMTEIAGLGTTHAVHAPPVPGSIGVSLPGVALRVADLEDASHDAAPGTPVRTTR